MKVEEIIKDILFESNIYEPEMVYQTIITCYNDKNRYYHNLSHVENVLRYSDIVLPKVKLLPKDKRNIRLALVFHDIIYDPTSKNNERNSAKLFKKLCEKEYSQPEFEEVSYYILATQHNGMYLLDSPAKLVVDFDLAGLAENWNVYEYNTKNIYKEYHNVYTTKQFQDGRKMWIQEFLAKPKIFQTEFFDEEKARNNFKKELSLYV